MTPINLRFWWNIGSILGLLLLVQIGRGFLLTFYFSTENRFYNLLTTYYEVLNRKLIQIIHINFSRVIFFFLYLHIFKAIYFSTFSNQFWAWMRGSAIMLIVIGISFLGYVLPWGQISLWGATVITNLISILPYGTSIVEVIWGGYFVSTYTLKLFYSLHFILPFILLVFIIIHMIFLHYKGSSNPLSLGCELVKIEFSPFFILKDLINLILVLTLMGCVFLRPNRVAESDNFIVANIMASPLHIKPEW